jgi:hypothetical protein
MKWILYIHTKSVPWNETTEFDCKKVDVPKANPFVISKWMKWIENLHNCHCVTKKRELEREIWRNTDTTNQGTHADPNRIRTAWSFDLHQTSL